MGSMAWHAQTRHRQEMALEGMQGLLTDSATALCLSSSARALASQDGSSRAWKKPSSCSRVSLRSSATSAARRPKTSVPSSISRHSRAASCRSRFGFSSFAFASSSTCAGRQQHWSTQPCLWTGRAGCSAAWQRPRDTRGSKHDKVLEDSARCWTNQRRLPIMAAYSVILLAA